MSDQPQLSQEELTLLRTIMAKLASPIETLPEKKTKSKGGRPKKEKDEQEEKVNTKKRGETAKNTNKAVKTQKVSKGVVRPRLPKGKTPPIIPLTRQLGGGPNLFEYSEDYDSHREDIAIDKKLSKNGRVRPVARRERATTVVNIRCSACNKAVKAHPDEINKGGSYRCSGCITGNRAAIILDDDNEEDE